jgi:hypothetical protein
LIFELEDNVRRIALLIAPAFLALALIAAPQGANAQSADDILKSMPKDNAESHQVGRPIAA